MKLQSSKNQGLTDRIMTKGVFVEEFVKPAPEQTTLSDQDLDVLLRYMSRDKGLLSYDNKTIKFKETSSQVPDPLTPEDATIASLKVLISNLKSQIETLNDRIAKAQVTAESAVKSRQKSSALSALKSKKLAERTVQQRIDTLNQLEDVYTKIEQAVDQLQIVSVMQNSAVTLKSLNKRIGGAEKVENIVDDLREQMIQVDEVGHVLQEPLDADTANAEAEIDDEFAALEKEEATRVEAQEAAATQERLNQLERVEADRQRREEQRARSSANDTDKALDSSIERLERMTIQNKDEDAQATSEPQSTSALAS